MHKIRDYAQFIKLRLSLLVVFSAVAGFVIASSGNIHWSQLFLLIVGGFLVTGASNGFNQVIERDFDKLMTRTANRPLPTERMSVREGIAIALLMGISGIFILGYYINFLSGLLAFIALSLYIFVYTPLKRITPFAVFAGAFPGAIPALLGWVAVTNSLSFGGWVLFSIQFIWQFPHFWAIAWMLDEDYKKAGFKMLPSIKGRDKRTAFQTIVYTVALVPMSLLPLHFQLAGTVSAIILCVCSAAFTMQAIRLYNTCSTKSALQLMFGSFIYLPVVFIALMADKW